MRRLPLLLIVGAMVAAPTVQAEEPFLTVRGTVTLPNPVSTQIGGLTELLNPCGTPDQDLGDLNGLDGFWIELPDGAQGREATMVSDAVDMDVWFYTGSGAGCSLITDDDDEIAYDMATTGTANEAGVIPAEATYAIVDLVVGVNAAFTFTVA